MNDFTRNERIGIILSLLWIGIVGGLRFTSDAVWLGFEQSARTDAKICLLIRDGGGVVSNECRGELLQLFFVQGLYVILPVILGWLVVWWISRGTR